MKKNLMNVIIAGALLGAGAPAMADHTKGHIKGYNSMDSMGCMIIPLITMEWMTQMYL